ncbi:MAG: hypothetical protein Q9168_003545 [Polycauliona sp. 1 TL-2023]
MASDEAEAYLLPRNTQESQRLNNLHEFMRQMTYGHLIHPSIPIKQLQAVADIGAGTGIWLQQLAKEPAFHCLVHGPKATFIGFDKSDRQFPAPEEWPAHVSFRVHDIVEPFPSEYHEKFDLINLRLLTGSIQSADLDQVVRNVLELLRNIAGPLVKSILSVPVAVPTGLQNIVSWTGNLMRLLHLETISTFDHPSPTVEAVKKYIIKSASTALLGHSINRRSAELEGNPEADPGTDGLREEMKLMRSALEAIENTDETASWEFDLTWIVARKAIVRDSTVGWMKLRRPSS